MNRPIRQPNSSFRSQVRNRKTDLILTWNIALEVRKLFIEEENIWPDQCDFVLASLSKLNEPVKGFYEFLNTVPLFVSSLRYPLIIELHHIEALVEELLGLIAIFSSICRKSTRQTMIRQQEIRRKLETLVQNCEDALRYTDILLDQVRFREHKLEDSEAEF